MIGAVAQVTAVVLAASTGSFRPAWAHLLPFLNELEYLVCKLMIISLIQLLHDIYHHLLDFDGLLLFDLGVHEITKACSLQIH